MAVQWQTALHRYSTNTTFGMANQTLSYQLNQHFEQQKNIKAAGYTTGIALLVLLFCMYVKWSRPVMEVPVPDAGVEVNLGNSDFGSGTVAPMMPGAPAPEQTPQQEAAAPPATQAKADDEEEPDPNDKEPAVTKTVEKVKPAEKPNNNPPVTKPVVTKEPPAPPQPKPKAQMGAYKGGNDKGGNNSDAFNNVKNQGNDPNGKGDKGKPNGNPNSDNYDGRGGTGSSGGVSVVSGTRRLRPVQLKGDFTRDAILSVRIKVASDGSGTYMGYVSGINESQYTNIIKQRLASRDIQFNSADEESIMVIKVVFKVN